ncbi:MAG: efflux RND transporter permease subunit [Phycisphaerales bacterium]|nr:efflux RND transporter permease subunit [Phycisphaerales bacterium]
MSLASFGVRKHVVANLVMFALIGAGLIFGTSLRREFFPYIESRIVTITAPYPGAAPEEVESALAKKIEDKVADLSDVDEISSMVSEGMASVTVTFNEGVPIDRAVSDVKREIDSLQDLPDGVDNITVDKLMPNMPAIVVALYGETDERTMKHFIKEVRDDLLLLPEITDIALGGDRRDELRVEVLPERAIEHGLSLPVIADKIRQAMIELPGGSVRTSTSTISVRSMGVDERASDVREIVVKATGDGGVVRVGDVAEVTAGFVDTDLLTRYEGKPTMSLTVFRVGTQDVIKIAEYVKAYVAGRNGEEIEYTPGEKARSAMLMGKSAGEVKKAYKAAVKEWKEKGEDPATEPVMGAPSVDLAQVSPRLEAFKLGMDRYRVAPPPATLMTTTDLARFVEGRLNLLLRNALQGGALVFLTLILLLNWRISFWVAMGLIVSMFGTLAVMAWMDLSLNFLTMFGLIIVIGILVDDAIVVAENIMSKHEQGDPAVVASVRGADQVAWPVVSTVLTTICAFLPLALMNGQMGDFMGVLPIVVGCALGVSLIESLFILPAHMAQSLRGMENRAHKKHWWLARVEERYDAWRDRMINGRIIPAYARVLDLSMRFRYVAMALVTGLFIVSVGMVISGKLEFIFFETDDAETVNISIVMPIGTPTERTDDVVRRFELAAMEQPEVDSTFAMSGAVSDLMGEGGGAASSHLGQVILELQPAETRERTSNDVMDSIRAIVGPVNDAKSIRMEGVSGGPSGPALTFTVVGDSTQQIDEAVTRIKAKLGEYAGVYGIADDADRGQREIRFTLRDGAAELGFTRADLGRQIQGAVFGLEAFTYAGDREDVDVRVMMPDRVRKSLAGLEQMYVFTPSGTPVPLGEVAQIQEAQAFATIRRLDRQRQITVQADVHRGIANPETLAAEVTPVLKSLISDLHGVRLVQRGRQKDTAESLGSLPIGMAVASGLIYVILAWLFGSFTQPLVVMTAIPFAVIGMVWGHLVMGYSLTFLSLIGFVALAGIVVNDSLIFMEFFNERRREGMTVYEAGYSAGKARFRAILLTTITTVLGLMPLMLEQSFQAKFLIPMAITISCGLLSATGIILLVLPSLLMILDDITLVARSIWHGRLGLERRSAVPDPDLELLQQDQ